MKPKIHPQLVPLYKISRIGSILLLIVEVLLGVVSVLCGMLLLMTQLWILLVLPVLCIGVILLIHIIRNKWLLREAHKFKIGTELLDTVAPRSMALNFENIICWRGAAAVLSQDAGTEKKTPLVVALETSKLYYPPLGISQAEVWYRTDRDYALIKCRDKTSFAYIYNKSSFANEYKKLSTVFKYLLIFVVLAFGAGTGVMAWESYISFKDAACAKASEKWLTARGIILDSFVETNTVRKKSGIQKNFRAIITYQYEVHGNVINGHQIYCGYRPSSRHEPAESLIKKYPAGKEVDVFYAPEEIGQSVLEKGNGTETVRRYTHNLMGIAAMILAAILICPLIWVLFIKKVRSKLDELNAYL